MDVDLTPIPVLFVTWDRLEYSKKAFAALLGAGRPITITIWDNGSQPDTIEWLKEIERSWVPVRKILFHKQNLGLAKAMNWFFRKHHDAQYVVKVDNDTVLPKDWLVKLVEGMWKANQLARASQMRGYYGLNRIGAVSGTCLRPDGWTWDEWVENAMRTFKLEDETKLHLNDYICGTGLLINMNMIRHRGLLFEDFPAAIGGWTDYTRVAAKKNEWSFAFYSEVYLNLLNLAREHVFPGNLSKQYFFVPSSELLYLGPGQMGETRLGNPDFRDALDPPFLFGALLGIITMRQVKSRATGRYE